MNDLILRLRDVKERFIFQGGSQFANKLADELTSLREANERFGKRQEWWNEKMFTLEQEVERLRADDRRLRRLLALRSGIPHLYCDDGEASGQESGINIDFMREPVADIDAKLRALNVTRIENAAIEQHKPVYWEVRCDAHPIWMRVDEQQFNEYVAHGWEGQKLYTIPYST